MVCPQRMPIGVPDEGAAKFCPQALKEITAFEVATADIVVVVVEVEVVVDENVIVVEVVVEVVPIDVVVMGLVKVVVLEIVLVDVVVRVMLQLPTRLCKQETPCEDAQLAAHLPGR